MSAEKHSTTETHSTYFLVEADCENNRGHEVSRSLGLVRGMSDNGYPGWTAFGATHFPNFEAAASAVANPYSLSSYDSHYRGGEIRVTCVRETITTARSVEVVHYASEKKL